MKKFVAILAMLIVAMLLVGCTTGRYVVKSAMIDGKEIPIESLKISSDSYITLKNGGECEMSISGDVGTKNYEIVSGDITFYDDEYRAIGTIVDGRITFSYFSEGVEASLIFEKE